MKNILIITFDSPFPANYGGVRDVYERIRFIKKINPESKIDLIFCTKNKTVTENYLRNSLDGTLNKIYIENISIIHGLFNLLKNLIPFSMAIRFINKSRFKNVSDMTNEIYDIVLVDHLKSYLIYKSIKNLIKYKKTALRVHNIESEYYKRLFFASSFGFKKVFFLMESWLYKINEKKIIYKSNFDYCLYISKCDMVDLADKRSNALWLPYVINSDINEVVEFSGRSNQILYVGNLDSIDNKKALNQIIKCLNNLNLKIKLVVAGKSSNNINLPSNVKFIPNPTDEELDKIYKESAVFFNNSANPAGVKIKLIDSLAKNIPIITNNPGVVGSGFEDVIFNIDQKTKLELREHLERLVFDEDYWKDNVYCQLKSYKNYKNLTREVYTVVLQ